MKSIQFFNYSLIAILVLVMLFDPVKNKFSMFMFVLILIALIVINVFLKERTPPKRESPSVGYGNGFIGYSGFGGSFSGGRYL